MSGYGGNLTYPNTKILINSGAATALLNFTYTAGEVLLVVEKGINLLYDATKVAGYKVAYAASVAKSVVVNIGADAPCTDCEYESGFTVVGIAQKPGVFNDNLYGGRRGYYTKVTRLVAPTGGKIDTIDLQAMAVDLVQQIEADDAVGTWDANKRGALVDATMALSITGTLTNTITVTVPGFAAETFVATATGLATTTNIKLHVQADGDTSPVVFSSLAAGDAFSISNLTGDLVWTDTDGNPDITLTTKTEWKDENTFEVDLLNGVISSVAAAGSFEVLPWEEVWRQFAHMSHDTGFANMHAVEKPTVDASYTHYMVEWDFSPTAAIHGASHGSQYKMILEFYVIAAQVSAFEGIFDTWCGASFTWG